MIYDIWWLHLVLFSRPSGQKKQNNALTTSSQWATSEHQCLPWRPRRRRSRLGGIPGPRHHPLQTLCRNDNSSWGIEQKHRSNRRLFCCRITHLPRDLGGGAEVAMRLTDKETLFVKVQDALEDLRGWAEGGYTFGCYKNNNNSLGKIFRQNAKNQLINIAPPVANGDKDTVNLDVLESFLTLDAKIQTSHLLCWDQQCQEDDTVSQMLRVSRNKTNQTHSLPWSLQSERFWSLQSSRGSPLCQP